MGNSYAQLIDDFEKGILVIEGESLTDYITRMGGVDYEAKANGGIASLTPRSGYAQGIGPVGEGRSFPTNSKMPMMDPYKLFFMYQNKLMRDKKREGLARILEV